MAAFKAFKRGLPEEGVAIIIEDMARMVALFMGGGVAAVVPVACGHSRRPDCLSFRIAAGLANKIGAQIVQAFEHRFVAGVSHPKEFKNLPPLNVQQVPLGLTLVVDDVATSGFHMHEALMALRLHECPAFGLVWIGGVVRAE